MAQRGPRIVQRLEGATNNLRNFNEQINTDIALDWCVDALQARANMLEMAWSAFDKAYLEITLQFGQATTAAATEAYNEAIQLYTDTKIWYRNRIANLSVQLQEPRVPKFSDIKLEQFDGDFNKWVAWKAQFLAKVYETKLPVDQKIDLLSGAVVGPAADCVGQILDRDQAELDRIWNLLLNRYDNEYRLVLTHTNRILNAQKVHEESAEGLRRLIDTVDQELRILKRFNFNTDEWSPIIVSIVLSKLDKATHSKWEMDEEHKNMPKFSALTNFIERRISALRNMRGDSGHKIGAESQEVQHRSSDRHRRDRHRNNRVSYDNHQRKETDNKEKENVSRKNGEVDVSKHEEKDPCPYPKCNKTHRLWNCKLFGKVQFKDQLKLIEDWKLCPCCLIGHHAAAGCERHGCSMCDNAKHNFFLCPVQRKRKLKAERGESTDVQPKTKAAILGKRKHSE